MINRIALSVAGVGMVILDGQYVVETFQHTGNVVSTYHAVVAMALLILTLCMLGGVVSVRLRARNGSHRAV